VDEVLEFGLLLEEIGTGWLGGAAERFDQPVPM
jgi:hypothetical protein